MLLGSRLARSVLLHCWDVSTSLGWKDLFKGSASEPRESVCFFVVSIRLLCARVKLWFAGNEYSCKYVVVAYNKGHCRSTQITCAVYRVERWTVQSRNRRQHWSLHIICRSWVSMVFPWQNMVRLPPRKCHRPWLPGGRDSVNAVRLPSFFSPSLGIIQKTEMFDAPIQVLPPLVLSTSKCWDLRPGGYLKTNQYLLTLYFFPPDIFQPLFAGTSELDTHLLFCLHAVFDQFLTLAEISDRWCCRYGGQVLLIVLTVTSLSPVW